METNKIYNEDNLETMARMPNNSVDLIITSPPYEDVSGAGYGAKKRIEKESKILRINFDAE
jgi:DNA modification methylase